MGHLDKLIPVTQRPLPTPSGAVVADYLTATVKDAPRNVPRVKMRVRNRCTVNLGFLGNRVPCGEHVVSVYRDEVDKVLAMVEQDQQGIKAAQQKYRKRVAAEVRELLGNYSGTTDELLAELDQDGAADDDRKTALSKVLTTTSLSVEGIFRQDHDRDILPLDFAELIESTEHAEPKVVERKREQDTLAGAMGAALAHALPSALEGLAVRVAEILSSKQGGGGQPQQGHNQQRR